MNKSHLRQLALARRKNVSEAVFGLLNEALQQEFMDFITSFRLPHRMMSFQPIVERREVHMSFIHETLESLGHQLCFPRVENEHDMVAYLMKSGDPMITSAWGIQEPVGGTVVKPTDFDIILLPLLAFDLKGNRVGYGKGFYDRYLVNCRPDCLKIGISLFDPVDLIEEVESHDIPLDIAICPAKLYDFR